MYLSLSLSLYIYIYIFIHTHTRRSAPVRQHAAPLHPAVPDPAVAARSPADDSISPNVFLAFFKSVKNSTFAVTPLVLTPLVRNLFVYQY